MRLKVGLDARFALGERRGIGNYSLELFKAMAAVNQDFDFVFYSDREDTEGLLAHLPNSRIRVIRPGFYPLWEQVLLPMALRADRINLFHAVGNTAPIIMPTRTRLVITLCDVMYLKDETILPVSRSWYQRAGRLYRRLVVPPAAKNADHLLTISEFSRVDICETIPHIHPEKTSVTLLGLPGSFPVQSPESSTSSSPEKEPYLLHLGGLDPRKNTILVVRSFLDLKRQGLLKENLVILGLKTLTSLGLNSDEITEAKAWIHLPGFVPDTTIPFYYQHAQAFLFPSLYEGFGIPLLEAMASGTPIITSNISSLPEIAGEAAMLVNPKQSDELKAAIMEVLRSSLTRATLINAGFNRIARFNWGETAIKTLGVYQKLMNNLIFTYDLKTPC